MHHFCTHNTLQCINARLHTCTASLDFHADVDDKYGGLSLAVANAELSSLSLLQSHQPLLRVGCVHIARNPTKAWTGRQTVRQLTEESPKSTINACTATISMKYNVVLDTIGKQVTGTRCMLALVRWLSVYTVMLALCKEEPAMLVKCV